MKSMTFRWEDEETSRHVALTVDYSFKAGELTIGNLTPTQVTFLCPKTGAAQRSLGVHRPKSRQWLADQFRASAKFAALEEALLERHAARA